VSAAYPTTYPGFATRLLIGMRGLALLPEYVVFEAVCKMARRWK
jgi:hypothetical protein